ncbi:hypothetical protein SESBI_14817 [Sesbania bispinosa]|nr:hypothetical protein SESBI_14817 [Sesbania bispinosa]
MEEVHGSTSNASGFTRNIKITALINNLKRVKAICEEVPKKVCSDFERRYGQILDLLLIPVQGSILSALAQFWNLDLRCFELPQLDLVPTIEEYAVMLGIPVKREANIYSYKGIHLSMKKVAELIGFPSSQTGFKTRGSVQGWKQTFLEDHLKTLAEQGEWDFFKTTLAFTVVRFSFIPLHLGCSRSSCNGCFLLLQDARNKPSHGHSSRHPYVHGSMSQKRQRVIEVLQSFALSMEVVWVARHIPSGISAALRY